MKKNNKKRWCISLTSIGIMIGLASSTFAIAQHNQSTANSTSEHLVQQRILNDSQLANSDITVSADDVNNKDGVPVFSDWTRNVVIGGKGPSESHNGRPTNLYPPAKPNLSGYPKVANPADLPNPGMHYQPNNADGNYGGFNASFYGPNVYLVDHLYLVDPSVKGSGSQLPTLPPLNIDYYEPDKYKITFNNYNYPASGITVFKDMKTNVISFSEVFKDEAPIDPMNWQPLKDSQFLYENSQKLPANKLDVYYKRILDTFLKIVESGLLLNETVTTGYVPNFLQLVNSPNASTLRPNLASIDKAIISHYEINPDNNSVFVVFAFAGKRSQIVGALNFPDIVWYPFTITGFKNATPTKWVNEDKIKVQSSLSLNASQAEFEQYVFEHQEQFLVPGTYDQENVKLSNFHVSEIEITSDSTVRCKVTLDHYNDANGWQANDDKFFKYFTFSGLKIKTQWVNPPRVAVSGPLANLYAGEVTPDQIRKFVSEHLNLFAIGYPTDVDISNIIVAQPSHSDNKLGEVVVQITLNKYFADDLKLHQDDNFFQEFTLTNFNTTNLTTTFPNRLNVSLDPSLSHLLVSNLDTPAGKTALKNFLLDPKNNAILNLAYGRDLSTLSPDNLDIIIKPINNNNAVLGRATINIVVKDNKGWIEGVPGPVTSQDIIIDGLSALSDSITTIKKQIISLDTWKKSIWPNNSFFYEDWKNYYSKTTLSDELKKYIDQNIGIFINNPSLNGLITSVKSSTINIVDENTPVTIEVTYQGLTDSVGSTVGIEGTHSYQVTLKKTPILSLHEMLDKNKLLNALGDAYNKLNPEDKKDLNKVNAAINEALKNSVLEQLKDYPNKTPLPHSVVEGLNNANPSVDFANGVLDVGGFVAGPQNVPEASFDLFSPPNIDPAKKYVTIINNITSLESYKETIWPNNNFFTDDWLDQSQHASWANTLKTYMNGNLDTFLTNKMATSVKNIALEVDAAKNMVNFDVTYQGVAILDGDKVSSEVTKRYTITLKSTASVMPTLDDILDKEALRQVALAEIAKIPPANQGNNELVNARVSAALKEEAKKQIAAYADSHELPKWLKEALKAANPNVSYNAGVADIKNIPVSSPDGKFQDVVKGVTFEIVDSNDIASLKPVKSLDSWKDIIWRNNKFFVDDWDMAANKPQLEASLKQYITNHIHDFIKNPNLNGHKAIVKSVTINVDKANAIANIDVVYSDLIVVPGSSVGVDVKASYTTTLVATPNVTYREMVSLPILQQDIQEALKGVTPDKISNLAFINGVINEALKKSVKKQVNQYGETASLPEWMKTALSTATPPTNFADGTLTINSMLISGSGNSQTVPEEVFTDILNHNSFISRIKDVNLNPIKANIWADNTFFSSDWTKLYPTSQLQQQLATYINNNIDTFVSNPLATSTNAANVSIQVNNDTNSATISVTYNGLAIMDDQGNIQTSVTKTYNLTLEKSPYLTIHQMVDDKKLKDDIFAAVSKLPEADKQNNILLNNAINQAAKDSVLAQIKDFANKNKLPNDMKQDLNTVVPDVVYTDGTVTVGQFVAGDQVVESGDFIILDDSVMSTIKDVYLETYRKEIWPNQTIYYSDWKNIYQNSELSNALLKYIQGNITTFVDKPGWSTTASKVTLRIDDQTKQAIFEVTYENLMRPAGSLLPKTEIATYYLKLKNDPTLNITLNKNQFVNDVNNALSQLPESDRKNPNTLKDATQSAGVEAVKQQLQDYANKNELPQSMKDALNNATPNVTVDSFGNIHVDDVPVNDQIVNGFDVSLSNRKNTSWINDINLDSIKQSIWKNASVNKFFTSDWEKAPIIVEQDLLRYINSNIDTFVTNANLIPGAPSRAIAAKVEVMNNTHRARIVVTYSNIVSFPNALYGQNETYEYWVFLKANPKLSFSDMINSSQIKDTIAQNPDIDPNVIVHDMIIGNPVGQNGQIKDWVEANKNHLPNSYIEGVLNALAKDQPSVSYHDGVIELGNIIGSDGQVIVPAASIDLNASSGYSAMWAIFFILLLLAIILVIGKLIHDKRSYDEHNDRQRGKHLL